jgi:hypothetical protein
MPWVGFEPTIPESERTKSVHALDRAATVTGEDNIKIDKKLICDIIDWIHQTQDLVKWWSALMDLRAV